jgi:glycosyltransferase involved in cell wall biosynthesis
MDSEVKDKAMKLLYLMNYWPGLFITDLFREIQWLQERGHSVAVVSFGIRGLHSFESETRDHVELAKFDVDGVPVLQLDAKSTGHEVVIREVAAFAHKHETELAVATEARMPGEVACDLYIASGLPFAVRMRGGDVHSNPSPRLVEMLQYASAVCPMSQFLADILTGKRTLKKTPSGIPVEVSSAKLHLMPGSLASSFLANRPNAQSDDTQVIGAIGRAVPIKRFPDIIHAVAGLAADFPQVQLKIIGGGELLPELQALAARVGIGDRFEITGFHKWTEIIPLVREFHIYVQASELEAFPLSLLEAGFQGLPMVLSKVGSYEQMVEPAVNGYWFDPGDVVALREHLRTLLLAGAARREQMGKETLRILEQFTEENVLPRIEAIFQNAISHESEMGLSAVSQRVSRQAYS